MHIFLTGGNGLVGRSLLRHPKAEQHKISAPGSRDLDLLDYQKLHDFIHDDPPDIIIHAAGRVGGITANMHNQTEFMADNLSMGMNLVECAVKAGVQRIINLGSACIYPLNAPMPLHPDRLLTGPFEPTNEGYALAKMSVLKYLNFQRMSGENRHYTTIIPASVYGPHDKYDPAASHLVAAILYKLHHAKKTGAPSVSIWGDGSARREFMLVDDLADGIWFCLDHLAELPPVLNLGIGSDHSINDYYQHIARIVGYYGAFHHDLDKPVGMKQKLLDSTVIHQLGWQPKWSLEEGLAYTYQSFLESDWA